MPRQTDGNVSGADDVEETEEENDLDVTGNTINQNQEQNDCIGNETLTSQMLSSPSVPLTT